MAKFIEVTETLFIGKNKKEKGDKFRISDELFEKHKANLKEVKEPKPKKETE